MSPATAERPPGLSVRLKLTLSYAGLVMVAGAGLLAVVWVFLLRYVPDRAVVTPDRLPPGGFGPTRSDLLDAFAPKVASMLVLLLVFALVGGWVLAGQMLKPLAPITEAARRVGRGSLTQRIRLPGRRDELRDLADSFDTMLDQLEAHVTEQQRFAANASHELRTPLAITQTILDVAANDRTTDLDELVGRLQAVNRRAIELTEALLLLSRSDDRSFTRVPVDLSLLAEECTETLLPLADAHGVTLHVSGGVALAVGSEALLLQLATNLVHNAIVHNLPESGEVWVATGSSPAGSLLTVENTGGPISDEVAATLVEPFVRGSGRTRTAHSGVGLGLAIAAHVARAHGGTLTPTARPAGGLRVAVVLPAATAVPEPSSAPSDASGPSRPDRPVSPTR